MRPALPARTREYRSYIFESRNWAHVAPRDGDIVISTSYKSGTTWMQNIVLRLVFQGREAPAVHAVSPWVDRRNADPEGLAAMLAAQDHRRVLKSHLPLDTIPYQPDARYIVVVRDARDVFMSLWNHAGNYTDAALARMNDPSRLVGDPAPRTPADIRAFWRAWINRGWFPWQSEGYPHSGNLYHTQSWWDFRHLENILFVHFNDLLADLPGEIARVADHLSITVREDDLASIARSTRFAAIKANAAQTGPVPEAHARETWTEGLETFFFKGTNGRWKSVLTEEDLAMYARAMARVLSPDCARFVEAGRAAGLQPAQAAGSARRDPANHPGPGAERARAFVPRSAR